MRHSVRKEIKRFICFIMTMIMVLTSMPVHLLAAGVDYNNLSNNKTEIVNNKLPVEVAKTEKGKTAADLIKNPDQAKIYTLRTDYKVPKNGENKINYQPYVASVGENATEAEKAKVNKDINLPDLKGYVKPQNSYNINFQDIVDKAKNPEQDGFNFVGTQEFVYGKKQSSVKIVHKFQNLEDFNKYEKNPKVVPTQQTGYTGSVLEVNPIRDSRIDGFEPEADVLPVLVPEDTSQFEVEFRYNRKTYEVNFKTDGGSSIPTRLVYFEQTIPTVKQPTRVGSKFMGWKPSVDLKDEKGNTFKANEPMKDSSGDAIMDFLKANVKMPATDVTFTAVWDEEEKADYVIQFWTEKPDYNDKDDKLPLRDRYDFIGARRIDNADTGSTPNLTDLDIHGITFPDLNDGRLEKAQDNKEEFERYYFLNEDLTKKQNATEKDPNVQKSVSSTGETVYNVYYDRRVYTLYFTAASGEAFDIVGSFWPIITREGKVIGKEGSPYKVDVRFNQSLDKIWPKDEEVSNLPPASSEKGVDIGLIGWIINNNAGEQIYRDTPPYRLSAEDFIDAEDVMSEEDYYGYGHADQIPIKDGETKKRDKYEISIGSTSYEKAVPHHIDIIKDDFDGNEQIDYEMSYWKSDTNGIGADGYPFILPHLQGFTLKQEEREAEWILEKPTDNQYRTINDLNGDRNKKTPFRSDADKIEYIDKFPWGTKSFDGKNAYNYANYSRNKYKLKLNNDPKTVKNDSEYGEGNILDVPYELPLKDLKLDTTHKAKKPNWVRDDWSFLGWALDPAGDNLVKDGKETKLHYDQVLYAKWGEPDYKWKVIFDPNGGSLRTIDENKLTTERKTLKEGDIGQEKETTYPIKEANQAGKQVFTVIQKQKLIEPKFKPVRKGYDFMGWEIIRYKKNEQGDYTEEIDNSYRENYKVPELYSFGNDVVSSIYLKAIWVPNARVDIDVLHYYLDKDYNLDTNISPNPDPAKLENKRAGYLVATTGDRQDDKYTLVPHDELNEKLTGDLKTIYDEYNNRVGLNNSFFQTFRVEPEKIDDGNGNLIDNPNLKNNVFKFFYRPYRQREYKVNYIDESFRGKENEKDGAIIDQELVENGNRHYDARNYRPIPGWVLTSPPQQQLFFDVDEDTNEFKGINGTGKDEITFYYKDVRVIEVPEGGKTPDGYVRVTFKADKGGSFGKDAEGNDITELHYDVIKGLKSDLLPVPKELAEGEPVDEDKHYITPETGRIFTKWDNSPLLNANTIINNNHTFTAYFEWSGLSASGLVRTEAYKDPNGKWTNDFAPTIEDLKKQLVWREKDQVKDLPAGTEIKFFYTDEAGIEKELTTDDQVFELVNEKKAADKDQLVRTVNIKAKVTFTNGKDAQELDIPVKVYKNVYEALTGTAKPLFLKDAESSDLKDITGEYVKVTVAPTGDMNSKDNKVYYVNPKAWVSIPEVKADGSSSFINWTADKADQNEGQAENGIFDFAKRHKFTEDTIISPVGAEDVVEQKQGEDKPKVPDTFVKVIVKTTDKATDTTAFEKTFWVNPTKEVTIDVINPTGKTITTDTTKYTMKFSKWENKEKDRTWEDKIVGKFVKDTTIIAKYSIKAEIIKELLPTTDKVHTPQGKTPTVDEIKEKITPPEGKTIKTVTIVENPKVDEPGESKVKVIIEYTDGSKVGTNEKPVEVPVEVHKNIIPEAPGGQRPKDALDNYVKVIFKAGTGGSLSGNLVYYVSPEVEVNMTSQAEDVKKNPSIGYTANGGSWSPEIKAEKITAEKTYEFNFVKSADIVEKTDDPNQEIPKGYVEVTFKTEDANKGKLEGGKLVKVYYVNPKAGIKLKVLEEGQRAGEKELKVPETLPAKNYVFDKWQENIDEENPITDEKIHVAMFQAGKVTLTYNKGGADVTGDLPANVTAKYGATVRLAGAGNLKKPNASFAGWKLDEDEKIYQPGDQVTLEKARTATAQWTEAKHTVTFNSKGGTDVASQTVDYGKTATNPAAPTQDGKVFMGWKEKESDTSYFDFNTPITADKTLIAIWQDPVQEINEGDSVEEQFIKVTFNKGKHGDLEGQTTYKVAKDLSFEDAVKKGLNVPTITPDKYYKAKDANSGWDKDLKLQGKDIEFIAQYEPIADVIPVDPDVTDDNQIEEEKPEGMVLVTFKVSDDDKLYIPNNDKYYVKKDTEVRIPTPVVLEKTTDAIFNGWQKVTLVEETLDPDDTDPEAEKFIWVKQSFKEDTIISDENTEEIKLLIKKPFAGDKRIYIQQMSADSIGKLELIRGGEVIETVTNSTFRRKYEVFNLSKPLQSGDVIRYWQESSSRISDSTEELID